MYKQFSSNKTHFFLLNNENMAQPFPDATTEKITRLHTRHDSNKCKMNRDQSRVTNWPNCQPPQPPSFPLGKRFNPQRWIRLHEGGVNQHFTNIPLLHSVRVSFRNTFAIENVKKRSWKVYRRGAVRPSQMSRTSMFPPILRQFHSGNCILNASRIPSTLIFLRLLLSLPLSSPFRLPSIR